MSWGALLAFCALPPLAVEAQLLHGELRSLAERGPRLLAVLWLVTS